VTSGRSVVFTSNKTDRHDITEILLKETLNAITLTQISNIFLVVVVGAATKQIFPTFQLHPFPAIYSPVISQDMDQCCGSIFVFGETVSEMIGFC
jgi:hypothetical protein